MGRQWWCPFQQLNGNCDSTKRLDFQFNTQQEYRVFRDDAHTSCCWSLCAKYVHVLAGTVLNFPVYRNKETEGMACNHLPGRFGKHTFLNFKFFPCYCAIPAGQDGRAFDSKYLEPLNIWLYGPCKCDSHRKCMEWQLFYYAIIMKVRWRVGFLYSPRVFLLCSPYQGSRAKVDEETSPVFPYGQIKPVLIMSIQVGTSAIIG